MSAGSKYLSASSAPVLQEIKEDGCLDQVDLGIFVAVVRELDSEVIGSVANFVKAVVVNVANFSNLLLLRIQDLVLSDSSKIKESQAEAQEAGLKTGRSQSVLQVAWLILDIQFLAREQSSRVAHAPAGPLRASGFSRAALVVLGILLAEIEAGQVIDWDLIGPVLSELLLSDLQIKAVLSHALAAVNADSIGGRLCELSDFLSGGWKLIVGGIDGVLVDLFAARNALNPFDSLLDQNIAGLFELIHVFFGLVLPF